ncbi:MAG TPA: BlaI/MecI/CopY family transcriptional regulator [Candidatus Acidoferrales bacterium]|nr:BlaI/MecI/CopY family transcriptional regulator [Candidatus Acidoferrales bacterium]
MIRRRKLLELAPLELECMTTLWGLREGTVREIRDALAARRPRAYTTIMTIMDRLARKQIVARHRVGRAWSYQANLSRQEARSHAIEQVVESFFGGSAADLLEQVSSIVGSAVRASHVEAGTPENGVNLSVHAVEPSH